MNKYLILIVLYSATLLCSENKSSQQPVVIKVIEGKRIVSETVEGKAIEKKLNDVRIDYENQIKSYEEDIQKKLNDLQNKAKSRVVDNEVLEKLQADIVGQKKHRDTKAEIFQEQFSREAQRLLAKYNEEIKKAVEEVAAKKGWDIVKIKESGEIVYSSPRVDASDSIIEALDVNYKLKNAKSKTEKDTNKAPLPKL